MEAMSSLPWRGPGPGPPGPAAAARTRCRCAAAAAGASAGATWARSATSCCSAPRAFRWVRWARPSGRSGTARAGRCGSGRGCWLPGARGEVWTERPSGDEGLVIYVRRRGLGGPDRGASTKSRRGARPSCASAAAAGWSGVPDRRGRVRVDPKAGRRAGRVRRPDRRSPLAGRGARGRGRVGRLPPASHGLELVGRRRHGHRRALGGLEPGQRHQRPAGALRARDLGRRRALRARPGRASRASTAIAFDDGSRLEFSGECERRRQENRLVVRYTYRQPFGIFSGTPARAGSSWSAASASWSTTTPTGEAPPSSRDRRSPPASARAAPRRREVVVVAAGEGLERDQPRDRRLEQRRRGVAPRRRPSWRAGVTRLPAERRAGRASR